MELNYVIKGIEKCKRIGINRLIIIFYFLYSYFFYKYLSYFIIF